MDRPQVVALENSLGAHGASYLDADAAAALGPEFVRETDIAGLAYLDSAPRK
ncbi:hypothetical protein MSC49_36100 [Methylosinus sp. C49]|uniref:hypothetical protein n=1 Tax=Methylosinus sp. C49 TaxID=2699395 RepID=UPI001366817B|nr:hypothetical protein [Methylosinus sp. C49]BBU63675.1 hypothetical protein MSC49_36100 [Methylosinus sp. C49]